MRRHRKFIRLCELEVAALINRRREFHCFDRWVRDTPNHPVVNSVSQDLENSWPRSIVPAVEFCRGPHLVEDELTCCFDKNCCKAMSCVRCRPKTEIMLWQNAMFAMLGCACLIAAHG